MSIEHSTLVTSTRQQRRHAARKTIKAIKREHATVPERQHTAIHEAGHAVVGYQFGVPITSIRVAPPGHSIDVLTEHGPAAFVAHTDFDWEAWKRHHHGRLEPKLAMLVALAGYVANRLFPCASEEYDRVAAIDDFRDLELMLAAIPTDDERTQIIQTFAEIDQEILERHHEAVVAVAAELMQQDELPGAEVWAICDPIFERLSKT